jgi:hypothetical protein
VALVQQKGFSAGAGTTTAVTITSSTAGNTLLVVSAGIAVPSGVPTDNLSTVWPTATVNGVGTTLGLSAWVLQNCPSGITTITVHQNAGQGWIIEENGLLTASLDKFASQQFTGTAVTSGPTATLTQANEVCYGFCSNANNITYVAGSGWDASVFTNQQGGITTVGNQQNTVVGPDITFIERQVVTATTAISATMTQVGGGYNEVGIITLMQSGGGGGSPPAPMYYRKNVLYFI